MDPSTRRVPGPQGPDWHASCDILPRKGPISIEVSKPMPIHKKPTNAQCFPEGWFENPRPAPPRPGFKPWVHPFKKPTLHDYRPTIKILSPTSKLHPAWVPDTFEGMEMLLQSRGSHERCECDECQPHLHLICSNAAFSHKNIVLRPGINDAGEPCLEPPLISGLGACRSMDLARKSIAYGVKPIKYMNSKQKDAIARFDMICDSYGHSLDAEYAGDVSTAVLGDIAQCFTDVFFFGWVPVQVIWKDLDRHVLGQQTPACGHGQLIELDPIQLECGAADRPWGRLQSRLGTILHELTHAFFRHWACSSCYMHKSNIGDEGHGRAWQLLMGQIERISPLLFGWDLNAIRFLALQRHMKTRGKPISWHDYQSFMPWFAREECMQDHESS